MYEEEESMEVSGGEMSPEVARLLQATTLNSPNDNRHRNTSLHNYSFDVSWSTWNKPPSPQRNPIRTAQLLSPARFSPSPARSSHWKQLNMKQEPPAPTVKVSQVPFKQPLGDITNINSPFSPNKTTDSYEFNKNWNKPKQTLFSTLKSNKDMDTLNDDGSVFESADIAFEDITVNSANNKSEFTEDIAVEDVVETSEDEAYETSKSYKSRKNGNIRKERTPPKSKKRPQKNSAGLFMWMFVIGGVLGLGTYVFIQVNFCSEFSINVKDLTKTLHANVFGQHMAVKSVLESVDTFVNQVNNDNSQRTLVLSFHGWTGVGKNYISKFIAEAFHNSRIFWYLVPLHFIDEDFGNHEINAKQWIMGNITKCGINVFIIDEMDKASEGLIKGVMNVIEELKSMKLESERDVRPVTLIIFLSNAKASHINQYLINQLEIGHSRKQVTMNEFQLLFSESHYEWYHELYTKDLIDVYIPFLPLEEKHVRQCIARDFELKGVHPSDQMIENVLKEMSFLEMGDKKGKLSMTGCKRVQDKVDLHIDD